MITVSSCQGPQWVLVAQGLQAENARFSRVEDALVSLCWQGDASGWRRFLATFAPVFAVTPTRTANMMHHTSYR